AIRCEPQEGVDQAIVPDDRQQGLLIVQCVSPDEFRGRIRYCDANQVLPRAYAVGADELEPIRRPSGSLDDPFATLRLRVSYARRQRGAVSDGVDDVPKVIGKDDFEFFGLRLELGPAPHELGQPLTIMIEEY